MIYLEFLDWQDLADFLNTSSIPATRLDILDASTMGRYRFFAVASMQVPKENVLAICSTLLMELEEPDFTTVEADKQDQARTDFCTKMRTDLVALRDGIAAIFAEAKLRVRPGLYSLDPPPVFKLRK